MTIRQKFFFEWSSWSNVFSWLILISKLQPDQWCHVVSAVLNGQKFRWLKQRLTGSKAEMALINKIFEFIMWEHPIDIEKLRCSLHHQVCFLSSFVCAYLHKLILNKFFWFYWITFIFVFKYKIYTFFFLGWKSKVKIERNSKHAHFKP